MNVPFTLSHPFRDQVTTADAEKRAVRFRRNRLGQVGFPCPRRAIQKDPFPRLSLALEQMRELYG
jgi:hypothetical protein